MRFWLHLNFYLLLYIFIVRSEKSVHFRNWWNATDPQKFEIARRFVDYKLAFPEDITASDNQICLLYDDVNVTANMLQDMINVCVNANFFPRVLSSSQVSLKKVKNDDEAKQESKSGQTQSRESKHQPEYQNTSKSKSGSNSKGDDGDDGSVIHRYLAFALVLPKHPFSRELIDSLHTVSPLYPHITVFFGISYEYGELCAQYGVRSFPKLLLFHNGLLVNKYGKDRDPGSLAFMFSKWTNSLPSAVPVVHKKLPLLDDYNNYNSSWFALSQDSHWILNTTDKLLTYASKGRSVEPLVTFSPTAVKWDFEIFALSGCYLLIRLLYSAFYLKKNRENTTTPVPANGERM